MDKANLKKSIKNIIKVPHIKGAFIFILILIIYCIFVLLTGFYLPCMFRTLTGYKCPGCGISHMFINIIKLDFVNAYKSNKFLFISLPILLMYFVYYFYTRIKNKKDKFKSFPIVYIVCLTVWGIVRNHFFYFITK